MSTLYNSPTESGLRVLHILVQLHPQAADLQTLVFLDHLLVHSGDVPGGPSSLHPATPARGTEVLVRRKVLQDGLLLYTQHGLVDVHRSPGGIEYAATESASPFLACLTADYSVSLRSRADWVVASFGSASPDSLRSFFDENLSRWGAEFEVEALLSLETTDD